MPVIIIVVVVFSSESVSVALVSVSCGKLFVDESERRTNRATVIAIATPSKRATTTARRTFTYNLRFLRARGLKVECICYGWYKAEWRCVIPFTERCDAKVRSNVFKTLTRKTSISTYAKRNPLWLPEHFFFHLSTWYRIYLSCDELLGKSRSFKCISA